MGSASDRRSVTASWEVDDVIGAVLQLVSGARLSDVLSQVVRTAAGLVEAGDGLLAIVDADDEVVETVGLDGNGRSAGLVGLASALRVPLRSRRGFRAHIYVAGKRGDRKFTEEDEELLSSYAAIAGAVVDKAQLYEEAQRRELWVVLQGEIATSLLAGVHINTVLDSVARGARELSEADVSTVMLYDGSSTFKLCAADGQGIRQLVGQTFPAEKTISGDIVDTGEAVILADAASADATSEPLLSLPGIGRALFVPLVANGATTGTLAVGRLTGGKPLNQTDFWLLDSFASQVSVALEYGRARSELERMAVVEDQERIARDLHDTVIQQLFATGMSLQATAQRTTDPMTAERIQLAVDGLDTVIRDIRAAVFALSSSAQGRSGIRAALLDIASQMFESSDVKVEVHFEGPVETAVDQDVQQHVIATVREALSNVNRHAHASRVDMYLHVGSELVLRVVDDGVGMGAGGRPRSWLLNLKARAERLGGRMLLAEPATGRTVLEWCVPWDGRAATPAGGSR